MIYGKRTNGGEHGTVYTNIEAVNFILTLSGLNSSSDFLTKKILDPSVGDGAFIIPLIERIVSCFKFEPEKIITSLKNITAVELDQKKCSIFLKNIESKLISANIEFRNFSKYIKIINDDYLTTNTEKYDAIIGNPPYVRYDNIPVDKIEIYRRMYFCFTNRSDIYIAFIEKAMKSLNPEGILTFICADRWFNNQYGKTLKKTIYNNFFLQTIVKIEGFSPFNEAVIAYPSIFSISNKKKEDTRYLVAKSISELNIENILQNSRIVTFDSDGNFFLTKESGNFISIEEQGFKIGIGVATGADKIFIVKKENVEIEESVLVPLITRKDLHGNTLNWKGTYVINPYYNNTTSLIDLNDYPLLHKYLNSHKNELLMRHVSQKNSKNWYRTIDRISIHLRTEPKLLLPDISTKNCIFFDEGNYYPHHNFYYISGNQKKDLLVLRAILSTEFVKKQIAEKGLLMNGGALRWQAQTLRKVKIPNILNMSIDEKDRIIAAYINSKENLEHIITVLAA